MLEMLALIFCPTTIICNNILQSTLHGRYMIIYTLLVAPEHFPLRHGVLEKALSSALLALLPRVDYVAPHVLYGV